MNINNEVIKAARLNVGQFIKELRKDKGLTQEDVAAAIGVTHATVNKIEQGKFNYGIDLFFKLSVVLGFRLNLETKEESDNRGRFDLYTGAVKDERVVIDKKTGIRVTFMDGQFNETQKVSFSSQDIAYSPGELATIMREIGEWLVSAEEG